MEQLQSTKMAMLYLPPMLTITVRRLLPIPLMMAMAILIQLLQQ